MERRRPKDAVAAVLRRLPHNVGYERIMYHVYVCQQVERGLRDVEAGRVFTQAEVKGRIARWLDERKRRAARAAIREMEREERGG